MIQTSTLWTIEGPDGTTLTLGDDPIYLEEVTGFADSPNVRTNIEELPEDDGAIAGNSFYGARPITLRGLITGATAAERNQHMLNLKRVFRALRGDVVLKSQPDGLPAMQAAARLEQLRISGPYVKTFHVGLICPDPLYYSQELHARSGPTNKITNPSFETGDLTGWAAFVNGGTSVIAQEALPTHGTWNVQAFDAAGDASSYGGIESTSLIDVDATKPYVLSGYFFHWTSDSTDLHSILRVICYDATGNYLGYVYPNELVTGLLSASGTFHPAVGVWERRGGRFRGQSGTEGGAVGGFMPGTKKIRAQIYFWFQPAGTSGGVLQLRADGFQFEQGDEVTGFTTGVEVAGARFPWAFPVSFGGGSGAFAEILVVNDGTADVAPVCRVWGPVTDPILENATTGEKLYLDGLAVAAGDFVDVDMAARTVKRADGSSAYDLVRFPDSVWWKLRPGSTSVQLRGLSSGTGVSLDVSWRDAWD